MGERKKQALRIHFDSKLKLEFHGAMISADAELLVYRELDEALGLPADLEDGIDAPRTGKNIQHKPVERFFRGDAAFAKNKVTLGKKNHHTRKRGDGFV